MRRGRGEEGEMYEMEIEKMKGDRRKAAGGGDGWKGMKSKREGCKKNGREWKMKEEEKL